MNPLTNVKNIAKLNERELKLGINDSCSWHKIYKNSPWIFIGGLDYDLTEGDVICVFSQYGEVDDINLVRDKKTGNSKGFCFLSYQDKTSTTLAVDNLNGIKLCGRTIRVDHVADYRPPKESKDDGKKVESDEDSIAVIKSERQDTIEEARHEDKQYKAVINENAEELSKEKHIHKSSKHSVPKEVIVDKRKIHTHHNRARDLSPEKSCQGSSSRHFDKDNDHSYKKWRTERKFHSSSDESIKHKLKKEKYKDSKSASKKRDRCHSSSDESAERTKHKSKHKHKKHKHKDSKHKNSD